MVNSVGKKLQQARIGKQVSIEEAARVTRIRPDKLIDLEEDNYANFPSMSYAKGFLLLYARFLGVDVRDFADTLHAPNPVSSDDYEYLNAGASSPPPPSRQPYAFAPRRERTLLPIVVFGILVGLVVLGIYFFVYLQRIGPLEDAADKKDLSSPSPAISSLLAASPGTPAAPRVADSPVLRSRPPALAAGSPIAAPAVAAAPSPSAAAAVSPSPALTLPPFDPSKIPRAVPVDPNLKVEASPSAPPVATGASPSAAAIVSGTDNPQPVKQITLRSVRRTKVTVRADVEDSLPVYQDWLYPGDGTIKLSGHKFWLLISDPGAVRITRDGQPVQAVQTSMQIE